MRCLFVAPEKSAASLCYGEASPRAIVRVIGGAQLSTNRRTTPRLRRTARQRLRGPLGGARCVGSRRQRPTDRLQAVGFEESIGLREVAATEKAAVRRQRRRVRR